MHILAVFGSLLGRHLVVVGSLLGRHWVIVGPSLSHHWVIVRPSPRGWIIVGSSLIGSSLGHSWVIVGSSLGHCWVGHCSAITRGEGGHWVIVGLCYKTNAVQQESRRVAPRREMSIGLMSCTWQRIYSFALLTTAGKAVKRTRRSATRSFPIKLNILEPSTSNKCIVLQNQSCSGRIPPRRAATRNIDWAYVLHMAKNLGKGSFVRNAFPPFLLCINFPMFLHSKSFLIPTSSLIP